MIGRGSKLAALAIVAALGLCSCKEGPAEVAGSHPPPPVPDAPRRIALIARGGDAELADVPAAGFRKGLALFQFTEGTYYAMDVVDLGGDLDAAPDRIDRAARDGAEVIVATHPDVLRAALGRSGGPPVAFGILGDPIALGVGEADDRHRPGVTGAYNPPPAFGVLGLVKTYLPDAARVGVAFVADDPLSAAYKDAIIREAPRLEVEIEPIAAEAFPGDSGTAGSPVPRIDALCLSAGLGDAAPGLISRAHERGIPAFGFLEEHVRAGAVAAEVPDLDMIGLEAGRMVYHLLSGRKPDDLPLIRVGNTSTLVNLDAIEALGITLPPGALRNALTLGGPEAAED